LGSLGGREAAEWIQANDREARVLRRSVASEPSRLTGRCPR
jgi:hypothetical protein